MNEHDIRGAKHIRTSQQMSKIQRRLHTLYLRLSKTLGAFFVSGFWIMDKQLLVYH